MRINFHNNKLENKLIKVVLKICSLLELPNIGEYRDIQCAMMVNVEKKHFLLNNNKNKTFISYFLIKYCRNFPTNINKLLNLK